MAEQSQTVRIDLPVATFQKLRRIAEASHRSVEDVLVTTIDAALPPLAGVSAEVADDLAALSLSSDAALWTLVETPPSKTHQERLHQLTADARLRHLTDSETAEIDHLIELSDQAILRRAKAMALLTQRGFDVSARVGTEAEMDDSQ